MEEKQIREFWIESTLKGFRNAIKSNSLEELISISVDRADKDAMIGGRFNKAYSEHHKEYAATLKGAIYQNKDSLCSSKLLKSMCEDLDDGVTVGLMQKLVNMSLKYLYSLEFYGYLKNYKIYICAKNCDCPLDSEILKRLSDKTGKDYTLWTKINCLGDYECIQKDIGLYVNESNLEFDFMFWGL